MIGKTLLEVPNSSTSACKLLLDFGVEVDWRDNIETEIRYAIRLVELNNEVFERLHNIGETEAKPVFGVI